MKEDFELIKHAGLRILVVDDERLNRVVLESMLQKMGHVPFLAAGGEEALRMLGECRPQMILMDVMMPKMNGYETTRAIRQSEGGHTPIIFLTALNKPENIIEGLHAGGDDYTNKPVHYELLEAKISALHQRQLLLAELSKQNVMLEEYKAHIEDDRSIAVRFMEKLSALERITDRSVSHYLLQAKDFGGDLIAAARTPSGCLHLLLADSAGHGLAAALSIMPVVEPFYKMTAKGFDISSIVAEMNKRVRKYVTLPRYVAANVISLDSREKRISVWNGGCPDALLIQRGGNIMHRFKSTHVPLGVFRDQEFDSTVEYYIYGEESYQIFMCSDGVTELGIEEGTELNLEKMFSGCETKEEKFDCLVQAITEKLDDQPALDDIAFVLADCSDVADYPAIGNANAAAADQNFEAINWFEGESDQIGWQMQLILTAPKLRNLDVVPMLIDITNNVDKSQLDTSIFIVLSELFNNALDHGLLKLNSSIKQIEDGMTRYYEEREASLQKLTEGQIEIELKRIDSKHGAWLKIMFHDSGDGFDYSNINQLSLEDQRHGRGLKLVRSLCDLLEFSDHGARVVAYLELFSRPQ